LIDHLLRLLAAVSHCNKNLRKPGKQKKFQPIGRKPLAGGKKPKAFI
jgi:hypothetical protein